MIRNECTAGLVIEFHRGYHFTPWQAEAFDLIAGAADKWVISWVSGDIDRPLLTPLKQAPSWGEPLVIGRTFDQSTKEALATQRAFAGNNGIRDLDVRQVFTYRFTERQWGYDAADIMIIEADAGSPSSRRWLRHIPVVDASHSWIYEI